MRLPRFPRAQARCRLRREVLISPLPSLPRILATPCRHPRDVQQHRRIVQTRTALSTWFVAGPLEPGDVGAPRVFNSALLMMVDFFFASHQVPTHLVGSSGQREQLDLQWKTDSVPATSLSRCLSTWHTPVGTTTASKSPTTLRTAIKILTPRQPDHFELRNADHRFRHRLLLSCLSLSLSIFFTRPREMNGDRWEPTEFVLLATGSR